MHFEFATSARIVFGAGKLNEIGTIATECGRRALVLISSSVERARPLLDRLDAAKITYTLFAVRGEPDIALVGAGVKQFTASDAELVIGMGGGSVIDTGKAIAALAANPGGILDYLEVIGKGQKLTQPSKPYIAIPTTAGTGAEVTRNAVVSSPEHKLKVSLRSPSMLPKVALVDPELTYNLPPAVTAATGMDAITQVIEPYVSNAATPITDALAFKGILLGTSALRLAYHDGDRDARERMALTSLFGGLSLANAKLGAVHGFAGVIGGMFDAPHGAICARLLPIVMEMNIRALLERDRDNPALARYGDVARVVSGEYLEFNGAAWMADLARDLEIPPLGTYGVTPGHIPDIVANSKNASSMKGNPIVLTDDELTEIMRRAL